MSGVIEEQHYCVKPSDHIEIERLRAGERAAAVEIERLRREIAYLKACMGAKQALVCGFRDDLERLYSRLNADDQTIRLACGEMTAGEMRTLKAWRRWVKEASDE